MGDTVDTPRYIKAPRTNPTKEKLPNKKDVDTLAASTVNSILVDAGLLHAPRRDTPPPRPRTPPAIRDTDITLPQATSKTTRENTTTPKADNVSNKPLKAPRAKIKSPLERATPTPVADNNESEVKIAEDTIPKIKLQKAPRAAIISPNKNTLEPKSVIQRRDTELNFGISRQPAPEPYHVRNKVATDTILDSTEEIDPLPENNISIAKGPQILERVKSNTQQSAAPMPLDEFEQRSIDAQNESKERLNIRSQELQNALNEIQKYDQRIKQEKELFEAQQKNRSLSDTIKAKWKAWRSQTPDSYNPPNLFAEIQKAAPHFSNDEIGRLIKNCELLAQNESLNRAFIAGGETVRDQSGNSVQMYTTQFIGKGGMAEVKEIFLEDPAGKLQRGVVKQIFFEARPQPNDHLDPTDYANKCAEVDARNQGRIAAYSTEVYNVQVYLQNPIPGVVKPLGIVTNAQGQTMVTYEKITGPNQITRDFESLDFYESIPPSVKFSRFVGAVRALANLHEQGIVHFDFKPPNVVTGPDGNGIIIDPGSMSHKNDQITVDPVRGITKTFENGAVIQLGFTPPYTNLQNLSRAIEKGASLEVADRAALGISLLSMLEDSGFYQLSKRFSDDHAPWTAEQALYYSQIQQELNLDVKQYPPRSIHRIYQLVAQLIDIESPTNKIPLHMIADELADISKAFEKDADQLYLQYRQSMRNRNNKHSEEAVTLKRN